MGKATGYTAYYFFLCFVALTWLRCSHVNKEECSKLKRGEFYYKSKATFAGSRIKRIDSIQFVTDVQTGKVQKERIEWIDPCTYMLYPFLSGDSLHTDSTPLKVRVLEVKERYYKVNVSSEEYKADFNDTVWIGGN
ncbi:MAG TPA: hypothetical protein VFI06_06405 [Chitinophagaceae bacterium]|nr:hypothetical protein [Chitinophagaceae bacterium]